MTKLGPYTLLREALKNPNEPTFMRALAEWYWRTLLVLLLLLFIGSLALGFSELGAARSVFDQLKAPQQTPPSALSRKDIDAVVAGFTARESRYGALKADPVSLPDPQ